LGNAVKISRNMHRIGQRTEEGEVKIALREEMTPGATLAEKLSWLEQHDIEGIELSSGSLSLPEAELIQIMAASPVEAANVAGNAPILDPDPKQRDAGKELIRRRLQLAGRLGAKAGVLLVPQFGRQPALPDLAPLKSAVGLEAELLVLQLQEVAPAAVEAGVPLFLEPLNRYEAHLVNRLDQAIGFAEQVGPEIRIMADFFHMNIEEADIAASIRAAGRQIVYVHVADNNRLQPGRGQLDFRPGFAALKESGYDGFLGIECRLDGPPEQSVPEAAALLRELWDAS
jgi:sugar phosphate isomerase/epimerase